MGDIALNVSLCSLFFFTPKMLPRSCGILGGTIQHNRGCAAGTYGQARTMVEDDQEHVHVKKEIVAQVAGATGGLGWEEEGVDLPSNMLGKTPDFKAEGGGNCVGETGAKILRTFNAGRGGRLMRADCLFFLVGSMSSDLLIRIGV